MRRNLLHAVSVLCLLSASALMARIDPAPPAPREMAPSGDLGLAGPASDAFTGEESGTWPLLIPPGSGTAWLWSLGATALPVAVAVSLDPSSGNSRVLSSVLIIGGLVLGPSAGQVYLGSYLPAASGGLVRLAGMAAIGIGAAQAIGSTLCDKDLGSRCGEEKGTGLIWAGSLVYLAGAAYSLMDIPFAARRRQMNEARLGATPFLRPGPRGGVSPGLNAWVRF